MTKKLTKQDIEKVAHERNHSVLVFENYQNVKSEITIYCRNCNLLNFVNFITVLIGLYARKNFSLNN